MKNNFAEHYRMSNEEFQGLWNESIIAFDTNVLFNLYRYSENTKDEIIKLLEGLKEKIWLPYIVGFEFHRKRIDVIIEEKQVYKEFSLKVNELGKSLTNINRNPFLSDALNEEFINMIKAVCDECEKKESVLERMIEKDEILEKVTQMFNDKVGNGFSGIELKKIHELGELRFKSDIPPGFKDKKKPIPDRYNDFVIWKELIEKSKSEKKPLIFVTDDRKEDWWFMREGKTISPLPELLKEFKIESEQNCYLYKPFQFLQYANSYLNKNIKPETIKEVKELPYSLKERVLKEQIIELQIGHNKITSNVSKFIETLKSSGYQIDFDVKDEKHTTITIRLPNIPDLERRFKTKYISKLIDFDLELIEYTIIENTRHNNA